MTASLYGIKNSNRDFSDPYYWGKNQFNSSFPIALACYMRDSNKKAVFLNLNKSLEIRIGYKSFSTVFNTRKPNVDLHFSFESAFKPFEKFVYDELKPIDLVIKDLNGKFLQPIEIKLTTIPDITTFQEKESAYGPEIVVRSPTMRYMALSMAASLENHFSDIRKIFEPVCHKIRNWDNSHEVKSNINKIFDCLESFFKKYYKFQKPLLMQPIWKTKGKTPSLAENCLDIFIWTDFALTRLFMDSAKQSNHKITRQQRAALRLARFLYELSTHGKVYQQPIYDGMTYDKQNDKEFSISGNKTNQYICCKRLISPIIKKKEIKKIILGGGHKYLSPERRFDAIIYYSKDLFK